MKFTTTIAAATAMLASAATAAPANSAVANIVAITQTGIRGDKTETPVKVPFGKLTRVDNLDITELQLHSVTVNVEGVEAPSVDDVSCRRYRDKFGVQPGGTEITKENPALIATNAVDFGWVLCYVRGNYGN